MISDVKAFKHIVEIAVSCGSGGGSIGHIDG